MQDCQALLKHKNNNGDTKSMELILHLAKNCRDLSTSSNGQVTYSDTTYPSVATYSCGTGFGLVGDITRICSAEGTWSGSQPECRFIYLGFYVAFNTVQVISRQVVGRAEETSTYSSLGFCTVNCRPTASNYQLSHLRPYQELNPGLRGGRRECYHSATVAPTRV